MSNKYVFILCLNRYIFQIRVRKPYKYRIDLVVYTQIHTHTPAYTQTQVMIRQKSVCTSMFEQSPYDNDRNQYCLM